MDRFRSRTAAGWSAVALAVALLLPAAGCNVVAFGMYFLKGMNVPAEFDAMKGKRVAVVCRPITSLQYNNGSVARELAKQVGLLLEKNVPKIKVIPQREVADWTDENTWEDYPQLGRALNADLVLGIDLEEFGLYEGQTLYRGRANLSAMVYDVKKEGKDPVWEKTFPQALYPPNTAIATYDKPEPQFRAAFIKVLAEQIARHFYEHDPTVDFASDSTALY